LYYVKSPITNQQLEQFDPSYGGFQFDELLTESDFKKIADVLEKHPNCGLRVYGNYNNSIKGLSFLKYFPNLTDFCIDSMWNFQNLDELSFLPTSLKSLGIGQTKSNIFSLKILNQFPNLESLYIESHNKDILSISNLKKLKSLSLRSITVPTLDFLVPLTQLQSLDIKLGGTNNLKALPKIENIKYLELWFIRGLNDISCISELKNLQYLFLQTLKLVKQLPDMKKLFSLRRVHLETLKEITDLRPLKYLQNLEELFVFDMPQLTPEDFLPLVEISTLKSVLVGLGSVKKNKAIEKMFKVPLPLAYRNDIRKFEFR